MLTLILIITVLLIFFCGWIITHHQKYSVKDVIIGSRWIHENYIYNDPFTDDGSSDECVILDIKENKNGDKFVKIRYADDRTESLPINTLINCYLKIEDL